MVTGQGLNLRTRAGESAGCAVVDGVHADGVVAVLTRYQTGKAVANFGAGKLLRPPPSEEVDDRNFVGVVDLVWVWRFMAWPPLWEMATSTPRPEKNTTRNRAVHRVNPIVGDPASEVGKLAVFHHLPSSSARAWSLQGAYRAGWPALPSASRNPICPVPCGHGRVKPWGLLSFVPSSTRPWDQGAGMGITRIDSAGALQSVQFPAWPVWLIRIGFWPLAELWSGLHGVSFLIPKDRELLRSCLSHGCILHYDLFAARGLSVAWP